MAEDGKTRVCALPLWQGPFGHSWLPGYWRNSYWLRSTTRRRRGSDHGAFRGMSTGRLSSACTRETIFTALKCR